ncbi:MAG: hypothetical protein Q8K45_17900 [Rubrivivax sp.]|nr:hypothetical protein [Rubrivivax sp.]
MALDSLHPPAALPATTADEAIALVLRRERAAHDAIAQAQAAALQMDEAARAEARAIAARAERHLRAVVAAFENTRQARTAALDSAAAAMAQPHALTAQDHDSLARAVHALAAELSGGPP